MDASLDQIKALSKKREIFCAVRFEKSRAKAYDKAVTFASKAHSYKEIIDKKKIIHLCMFANDPKQVQIAINLIEAIKGMKSVVLILQGEPHLISWRLINVMSCYLKSIKSKNQKAYCQKVDSDIVYGERGRTLKVSGTSIIYERDDDERKFLIPCKELCGFLELHPDQDANFKEQVEAVAQDKLITLCPFFDSSEFKELEPEPKRYWD